MVQYNIILGLTTLHSLEEYKTELTTNKTTPGRFLKKQLDSMSDKEISTANLTIEHFLQLILFTKKTVCFAESEIKGDGSDWNSKELGILGNISVAMEVSVFDNGAWSPHQPDFKIHEPPMSATLVFTPGPLLEAAGDATPDLLQVFSRGQIDQARYTTLVTERLLPVFIYAGERAKAKHKRALIVLPGLGCGAFAGRFRGKMGEYLNQALRSVLENHGANLQNIACIHYDPFEECSDDEKIIYNIKFRVRRLAGSLGKPQLSSIHDFEETDKEFADCELYKIVAWDHASLPGNDYYVGSRNTDDGVAAAATNSMEIITGERGDYVRGYYMPPPANTNWKSVAKTKGTHLIADRNVKITLNGCCLDLHEYINADQNI